MVENMQTQIQEQIQEQKLDFDDFLRLTKMVEETRTKLNQFLSLQKKFVREYKRLGDYVDVTRVKRRIEDLVKAFEEFKEEHPKLSILVKRQVQLYLPFYWIEEKVEDVLRETLLVQHYWRRKGFKTENLPTIIRLCDKALDLINEITTNIWKIYNDCQFLNIPIEKIDDF